MLQHEVAMRLLNYLEAMDASLNILELPVDTTERNLKTIDVEHHAIHEGIEFEYDRLFTAVAQDGYVRIHIFNDDGKELHVQFFTDTEAKAYVKSYIDSTYTNAGTLVTQWNRKTGATTVSVAKVYHTPTVNVLGSLRVTAMTGASGNQSNQAGGSTGSRVESIITTGHDILIEVQNKGSSAKDIAISARWYEVPGV